jgi:hypothetical protein
MGTGYLGGERLKAIIRMRIKIASYWTGTGFENRDQK